MNRGSYRSTNSILLDSEDWKRLSAKARHVYLTMKNSRLNNMAGIFLWDSGANLTICEQSGYKSIDDATKELVRERWIVIQDGMVWLRNCLRYDPTITLTNDNHRNGIGKVLGGLFNTPILESFCTYYGIEYPFNTHPPSHPIATESKETDKETETKRETERESAVADPRPPVEKWLDWRKSESGQKKLHELLSLTRSDADTRPRLTETEFREALKDKEQWLRDHEKDPKVRNRVNWSQSASNWMKIAYERKKERESRATGFTTNLSDRAYDETKRRTGSGGGFTKIGDMVND